MKQAMDKLQDACPKTNCPYMHYMESVCMCYYSIVLERQGKYNLQSNAPEIH